MIVKVKTLMATSLLIFLMGISLQAQTNPAAKAQSQAEEFSVRTGTLIKKEFIQVGSMKGVKLEVIVFSDMLSGKSQKALRLSYDHRGKYATSTKTATLDADEVQSLMQSITILQTNIFPQAEENYSEVTFKARGGFEAGAFLSKGNWDTYLKLERFDKDSYVFMNQQDFVTLKTLLQSTLDKMKD